MTFYILFRIFPTYGCSDEVSLVQRRVLGRLIYFHVYQVYFPT